MVATGISLVRQERSDTERELGILEPHWSSRQIVSIQYIFWNYAWIEVFGNSRSPLRFQDLPMGSRIKPKLASDLRPAHLTCHVTRQSMASYSYDVIGFPLARPVA